jgi:CheY-like chemotaxis protein
MKKILVIEDDKEIRIILCSLLAKFGYYAIEAANGKTGLELAYSEIPDMIISDIYMPEIDGYDVLRNIRGNPETSEIPFIFLSSLETQASKNLGQRLGVNDYIVKPFDPHNVLDTIERNFVDQLSISELIKE